MFRTWLWHREGGGMIAKMQVRTLASDHSSGVSTFVRVTPLGIYKATSSVFVPKHNQSTMLSLIILFSQSDTTWRPPGSTQSSHIDYNLFISYSVISTLWLCRSVLYEPASIAWVPPLQTSLRCLSFLPHSSRQSKGRGCRALYRLKKPTEAMWSVTLTFRKTNLDSS